MKSLYSLLALLALAIPSHAQTDSGDGRKVRIQFRALSFDEPILGAAYMEGVKISRLDISPDMFSQEQLYVGPRTLNFYKITLKEVMEAIPEGVAQSNAHITILTAKIKPLSVLLAKLQAEANAMTVSGGEQGGGKLSKQDQDKLTQVNQEIDSVSKQLRALEAEVTKEQEKITTHIQNAQAELAEAEKMKKAAAKTKRKVEAAITTPMKPEPVEVPVQIAACSFADSGKYLLLFFKDGEKRRVLVMDDKENAFPYGSIQYINLTRKSIQIRYGDKITEVPSNGRKVIPSPAPNETYARGEILTPGEDGYQLGFATRTFQQQDVRTLFFVTPVETEGSHIVRVKGIEERKQPDPVADPNAGAANGGKAAAK